MVLLKGVRGIGLRALAGCCTAVLLRHAVLQSASSLAP